MQVRALFLTAAASMVALAACGPVTSTAAHVATVRTPVPISTASASAAQRPGIWFEDNNMGVAGGAPADFYSKFRVPDSWAAARRDIDVYYVRSDVLEAGAADDDFLRKYFLPVLATSHIKLALDSGSATWLNSSYSTRIAGVNDDVALVRRIERLGGTVAYIGLQSTLSKPLVVHGQKVDYAMSSRIEDAVDYAAVIKKNFPNIKIGLIDALPSKGMDYEGPYRDLAAAFTTAGLTLDFIQLDSQYDSAQAGITTSWAKIARVESFVKHSLHLHFGLVATSRTAGYTSDEAYHDAVLDVPVEYREAGGEPDEYVIMSWYPHPTLTVPDSGGDGRYPAMKTVLELHDELLG